MRIVTTAAENNKPPTFRHLATQCHSLRPLKHNSLLPAGKGAHPSTGSLHGHHRFAQSVLYPISCPLVVRSKASEMCWGQPLPSTPQTPWGDRPLNSRCANMGHILRGHTIFWGTQTKVRRSQLFSDIAHPKLTLLQLREHRPQLS